VQPTRCGPYALGPKHLLQLAVFYDRQL
jgi:hypothetical protein